MAGTVVTSRSGDAIPHDFRLSPEVPPRAAASTIILRDSPYEVLMLRRHESASFVPDTWVFPGGVLDPPDHEIAAEHIADLDLGPLRVAAARETFEESGVWLGEHLDDAEEKRRRLLDGSVTFRDIVANAPIDFSRLVWAARWITPVGLPKRFDTWFFAVVVTREIVATPELNEAVEAMWIAPAEALARHAAGTMKMVFPTIRTVELLASFARAEELLADRRAAKIETILPVITENGGRRMIVIP